MCEISARDLIRRQAPSAPWAEGDNIPWHDPAFSARMLREHLSQDHDAASRRFPIIDRHTAWIHEHLLGGRPGRILDLGCGPGLYASRLARMGHRCRGIDYSPASIAYARETADGEGLACTYVQGDIRHTEFGRDFDLAMLIYGELNVFRPDHAQQILARMADALAAGGRLLLEPHTFDEIHDQGTRANDWHTHERSVFGDFPHWWLNEYFWHEPERAATIRYHILDPASCRVTRYAQSMQAYHESEYRQLLEATGFTQIQIRSGWPNRDAGGRHDFHLITAMKP